MNRDQRQFLLKMGLLAMAAGGALLAARLLPLAEWMQWFADWIKARGAVGIIAFAVAYTVGTMCFMPASLFTVGAAVAFGFAKGLLLAWTSASLAAAAPFFISRYFARDFVERQIARHEKLRALDAAIAREGWKVILLIRVTPIFPFPVCNYFAGLTRVRFWPYFFASSAGIIPGTTLYAYLGHAFGMIFGQKRHRTPQEYAFLAVGLIATIIVVVYLTRLARRALHDIERRHLPANHTAPE